MVLEQMIDEKTAKRDPLKIFLLGAIVSIIAIFIANSVFPESTGLFSIIIITMTMIPLMNRMLHHEEAEDEKMMESYSFFQRYGDIIVAYMSLFSGMILAMSLIFVLLPQQLAQDVFDEQLKEINLIRGHFTFENQFLDIFVNNLSVLILAFLFSFLFGSGAIFILSWNASVLSAAIGLVAKSAGGVTAIPAAVLMFLPHGFFEITAYLIGAIAGGLISAAFLRKKSFKFWHVAKDCALLLLVAFVLLIIGGIIETGIILF